MSSVFVGVSRRINRVHSHGRINLGRAPRSRSAIACSDSPVGVARRLSGSGSSHATYSGCNGEQFIDGIAPALRSAASIGGPAVPDLGRGHLIVLARPVACLPFGIAESTLLFRLAASWHGIVPRYVTHLYGSVLGPEAEAALADWRSEGSPPWARSMAPQPCIRLDPHRVRTMKQSFASAAGLRGGGHILPAVSKPRPKSCHRHLGSSSAAYREAATSCRIRLLGSGHLVAPLFRPPAAARHPLALRPS